MFAGYSACVRKSSWAIRQSPSQDALVSPAAKKKVAGKMAEFHVYFISALVLSCCLQILAGYGRLAALCFYYISVLVVDIFFATFILFQEGFLRDFGCPSRREQKPNQASLQKVGDEMAP